MQNHLVVEAINDLIDTFILYGDPKAPYWLVGLEEGDSVKNGQTIEEFLIKTKTKKADRYRQSSNPLSLRELCGSGPLSKDVQNNKSIYLPNYDLLETKNYKIKQQCTWAGYAKLLHAIWNPSFDGSEPWTGEQISDYQAHHLGEPKDTPFDRQSCLMELFALPYQRRDGWLYKELSKQYPELSYLKSRSKYQKATIEKRINQLTTLITTHQPKFVIAFGGDCKTTISKAIEFDAEFTEFIGNGDKDVKFGLIGNTWIVFSMHPAGRPTSRYWIELGKIISQRCIISEEKKAA